MRAGFLVVAVLSAAAAAQTFSGVVTDSMCPTGDHSRMRMGANDAECTMACASAHGATYVLSEGKTTYTLSDQRAAEKFSGQKVKVIGTLDAKTKTIQVESISAAP